jgi:hypothetical protein
LTFEGRLGRIKALMIICIVALASLLFPPLDALENTILVARMVGDILFVLYSILLGYSIDRYITGTRGDASYSAGWGLFGQIVKVNRATKGVLLGLLLPAAAFTYWNFPINFDATALNVYTRYTAYFTYIIVAGLAGMAIAYMPKLMRVGLVLFAWLSVGMMGSMMLVWEPGFYTTYSAAQNIESNSFLMLIGAAGELLGGAWSLKALDIV